MKVTPELFDKIKTHCTVQLIERVGVAPDNRSDDTWDITEIVEKAIVGQNNPDPFHEQMKIAYVFEKLGGTLLYEKKPEQYVNLAIRAADCFLEKIRLYWIHNEANDVVPIYDFGNLIVPQILPLYSSRPNEDGKYVVERLVRGQYVEIPNEVYPTAEDAMERAKQLNTEI